MTVAHSDERGQTGAPLGLADGLNLCTYAEGAPLAFVDPSGL
jgi:hypothetical protein